MYSILKSLRHCNIWLKNLSRHYLTFKGNEIAVSGAPEDTKELNWLKEQGIKHILCLDKWEMSAYKKLGSKQLKPLEFEVKLINIEEFEAPDSETVIELLQLKCFASSGNALKHYKLSTLQWTSLSPNLSPHMNIHNGNQSLVPR